MEHPPDGLSAHGTDGRAAKGRTADLGALAELAPVPTLLISRDGTDQGANGDDGTRPAGTGSLGSGRISYANAAARDFLSGGGLSEPIGRSILDIADGDRAVIETLVRDAEAAGTAGPDLGARPIEGRIIDAQGRPMLLFLQPATDAIIAQLVMSDAWSAAETMLAEQKRFRSALMELSEFAHTTRNDDDFYLRLLQRAVDVVPGAQGGSIQLRLPDSTAFRFVAAIGYDLEGLQRHDLDQREFFRDAWDPKARIIRNFDNDGRSPEIREWLRTVGRLQDLVVNVSGPVLSKGLPIAFLSLDNFEDPDAMNETSVEMTTVLSRLIGELWSRRELEAEVRKEREAFKHLALHDALTGLANRRNLERSLSETVSAAARDGHPSCVLFVDLDDFKGVNDRHGHDVGDRLLVGAARGLLEVVRAGDTVGRWGGDEFLVVPQRLETLDKAVELAERLLAWFERELDLGDGRTHRAPLSVGVGWSPDSAVAVDVLVKTADAALYDAKTAGKGVCRVRTANRADSRRAQQERP